MSFAWPYAWLLFIPLIAMAIAHWLRPRQRGLLFSSLGAAEELPLTRWLARIIPSLRWLCLALLIVAIARPQIQQQQIKRLAEGLDVIMAVDTSGSMRALDFTVNGERSDRLTAVVNVLDQFVTERTNDRIGFVVFGTEAFTQAPLTVDHDILKKFLAEIRIGMAGDATAIGDAIAVAAARLEKVKSPSRIIILLTDGSNTAGAMTPEVAAQAAAALGIRIYTIGAGAEGEVPFPVQTPFGTQIRYQPSDLDESLLKKVAEIGNGQYFRAYDTKSLQDIYATIDKLEKSRLEHNDGANKRDLFAWFLSVGLLLLVAEAALSTTRLRKVPA